ncbi:MAG: asparaginase [Gemmatimonadota bacterium]|nr:asparaginase [Gemmatimonadota bacterium]
MLHFLFTGGTISMRHDPVAGGNVPALDGAALLASVPALAQAGPIVTEDWERLPAVHRTPALMWALRGRIAELAADPSLLGVVVPHGTDTLAEMAYLVARTVDPQRPVVLTGAMRTSSQDHWDGPRNLADAAAVAADPGAAGRGAMVVFAGRILDGLHAAKMHASEPDAFAAPHGVQLGRVEEGRVRWDVGPSPRPVPVTVDRLDARVLTFIPELGDDGTLLDLARPRFDGAVILGYGRGNIPPGAVPAIERWIGEGKPVILASRQPLGETGADYAFAGGGASLVAKGVRLAGARTPGQARLELMLALSGGWGYPG